jgi:class 3 adenylate cyclase
MSNPNHNPIDRILGRKIGKARVVPITSKILAIFVIFLVVTNLSLNYLNLVLNQAEQVKLMNKLLVRDLKEMLSVASSQHDLYIFNNDMNTTRYLMEQKALSNLENQKALCAGVKTDGTILFFASHSELKQDSMIANTLQPMINSGKTENSEGTFYFNIGNAKYYGTFKYNSKWDAYLLRAEELNDFNKDTNRIFLIVVGLILISTVVCTYIGIKFLTHILRYVSYITEGIMEMSKHNKLEYLDMSKAPNDDITYLGVSLNSLSNNIDTLMNIFRKFVTQDIVNKAYKNKEILLDGERKDLTILFSDIKSFTYMTETLGNDIIKLLNMHYKNAIKHIHDNDGIIGSIIGDALLAVFGSLEGTTDSKSHLALLSAYKIQDVAESLRQQMTAKKDQILQRKGSLTDEEERVYRAVLLEVGVGIDGGEVFYGTIGSYERMTNTVIGDNVNSSSRLEGLTRMYRVPVICSEYIKKEVEAGHDDFVFLELDQVQVKGKTIAAKIYYPIPVSIVTDGMRQDIEKYQQGLENYYSGKWQKAHPLFAECSLAPALLFADRTNRECPKDWSGIWTMTSK